MTYRISDGLHLNRITTIKDTDKARGIRKLKNSWVAVIQHLDKKYRIGAFQTEKAAINGWKYVKKKLNPEWNGKM